MKFALVVLLAMALYATCEGKPECANLTGKWTCVGKEIGNGTLDVAVFQIGCIGTTSEDGVAFTVSGYRVTFTGVIWNGESAMVTDKGTSMIHHSVKCSKESGGRKKRLAGAGAALCHDCPTQCPGWPNCGKEKMNARFCLKKGDWCGPGEHIYPCCPGLKCKPQKDALSYCA